MTLARRIMVNPVSVPPGPFEGLVQYYTANVDQLNKIAVDTNGDVFAVGKFGPDACALKLDSGLNVVATNFFQGDTTSNELTDIKIGATDLYCAGIIENSLLPRSAVFRLSKSDLSIIASINTQRNVTDSNRIAIRDDGEIESWSFQISATYGRYNSTLSAQQDAGRVVGVTLEYAGPVINLDSTTTALSTAFSTAVGRLSLINTVTMTNITDFRFYWGAGRSVNEWTDFQKDGTHIYACGFSDRDGTALVGYVVKWTYAASVVWDKVYAGTEDVVFNATVLTADGLFCVGYTEDFTGTNRGALIVKINATTGDFVAEKVFHNTFDCEFLGVSADADGNIYACGYLGSATNPRGVVMKLNSDLDYTSISPPCAPGLVVTNSNSSLSNSGATINTQGAVFESFGFASSTISTTPQSPSTTQEGPCAFN